MGGDFQFEKLECVQSLLARKAPILDLLQNKVLKAEIIRGTLVLKEGSAKLFAVNGLLKAHGCKFDAAMGKRHAASNPMSTALSRADIVFTVSP